MPKIKRPTSAYVQIHDHFRSRIQDGALLPRQLLPTLREIAAEWNVSPETAQKAVTMLKASGLVTTTLKGTFVADGIRLERSPADRLTRAVVGGNGEQVEVTAAGIVSAPIYVAEILDITPGDLVLRREEITRRAGQRRSFAVDWVPGFAKDLCAQLLECVPIEGGTIHAIERLTSRTTTLARVAIESRDADEREARGLGVPIGDPIMAGVHRFLDAGGDCLLYGEWCLPKGATVCYSYSAGEPA